MLYCAGAIHDLELSAVEKYQMNISFDHWNRIREIIAGLKELPARATFRDKWYVINESAWDYFILAQNEVYEQVAMEAMERLLEQQPLNFNLRHNIAYAYLLHGNYAVAIKGFNEVIDSDPVHSHAFNSRGLAHLLSGNLNQGLQDLETSQRLDVKSSTNVRNFGIYWLLRRQPAVALDHFKKAQVMNYKTPHILFWIGRAYYDKGNVSEAEAYFTVSRNLPELPVPAYPM